MPGGGASRGFFTFFFRAHDREGESPPSPLPSATRATPPPPSGHPFGPNTPGCSTATVGRPTPRTPNHPPLNTTPLPLWRLGWMRRRAAGLVVAPWTPSAPCGGACSWTSAEVGALVGAAGEILARAAILGWAAAAAALVVVVAVGRAVTSAAVAGERWRSRQNGDAAVVTRMQPSRAPSAAACGAVHPPPLRRRGHCPRHHQRPWRRRRRRVRGRWRKKLLRAATMIGEQSRRRNAVSTPAHGGVGGGRRAAPPSGRLGLRGKGGEGRPRPPLPLPPPRLVAPGRVPLPGLWRVLGSWERSRSMTTTLVTRWKEWEGVGGGGGAPLLPRPPPPCRARRRPVGDGCARPPEVRGTG